MKLNELSCHKGVQKYYLVIWKKHGGTENWFVVEK